MNMNNKISVVIKTDKKRDEKEIIGKLSSLNRIKMSRQMLRFRYQRR